MTNLFSVFVSYLSLTLGYQIYRSAPEVGESAPFLSLLVFLTALLLLLVNLDVYPHSLRCLGWFGTVIIEEACVFFQFLISYFLMETLMIDFWFPLEEAVSNVPTKIADHLEEKWSNCGSICEALWSDNAKVAASYVMSSLLLLMVLHATKLIDSRKLAQGPSVFIDDIWVRVKCSLSRILQDLGLCSERRVKISDVSRKRERSDDSRDGNRSTNSNPSRNGFLKDYNYIRRRSRRRCR
ncbi:unnamed protein product [Acanthoscelides obtectus]|uniref:Uncharacterized protein n=1 Tax=Acanthoscelides obtectus TaxID=200917 RepID=A0A9P0M4G7_ACAOB|nr:unnamed protein product [Acanthoscelides obtectus]CAK1643523.1 hypothetical protein AOBTE_LOCUS13561 [Acanthoscelides obtectus]